MHMFNMSIAMDQSKLDLGASIYITNHAHVFNISKTKDQSKLDLLASIYITNKREGKNIPPNQ